MLVLLHKTFRNWLISFIVLVSSGLYRWVQRQWLYRTHQRRDTSWTAEGGSIISLSLACWWLNMQSLQMQVEFVVSLLTALCIWTDVVLILTGPVFSGIYTCVAWNREGADTRSLSMFVDSVGGQAGDLSWWDGAPSREQNWPGNLSDSASSLVVVAKVQALTVFLFPFNAWSLFFFMMYLNHSLTLNYPELNFRWWTTSRWCWSGSCFPAGKPCRQGRPSRHLSWICPSGSAPPCTSTILR